MHQIDLFCRYPHEVQEETIQRLLKKAEHTEWGKKYYYNEIKSLNDFCQRVPLGNYESHKPDIERTRRGEENILWPGAIRWFAKSSGTTADKSKFLPVSMDSLDGCHYNAGRDMIAIHCNNTPDTQLFTGKNLALGGSHKTDIFDNHESYHGDVSAIIIQNLPLWAEYFRAPELNIALIENWDEKLEKLMQSTMNENITSLAGVPSWMLVLCRKIIERKGAKSLKDIWPNLEVFFHGGVSLTPYKNHFKDLFNNDKVQFLQLYNASEGFFGIQDLKDSDEMLLMLDYGIYYEFISINNSRRGIDKAIPLSEVQPDVDYEMVITTNAGLWRYRLGDTVRFTSILPYRIQISGRTKHFINVFGEELMVDNTDKAIAYACEKTNSRAVEYTVAPVFMGQANGCHQWLIEFETPPESQEAFLRLLDEALKACNSDYEAKRYNNYVIGFPEMIPLKKGCFDHWLKAKGKSGSQAKIPRLSNQRNFVDEILLIQSAL
jgi:hypothetical protein